MDGDMVRIVRRELLFNYADSLHRTPLREDEEPERWRKRRDFTVNFAANRPFLMTSPNPPASGPLHRANAFELRRDQAQELCDNRAESAKIVRGKVESSSRQAL